MMSAISSDRRQAISHKAVIHSQQSRHSRTECHVALKTLALASPSLGGIAETPCRGELAVAARIELLYASGRMALNTFGARDATHAAPSFLNTPAVLNRIPNHPHRHRKFRRPRADCGRRLNSVGSDYFADF